jgi:hypothetical protein
MGLTRLGLDLREEETVPALIFGSPILIDAPKIPGGNPAGKWKNLAIEAPKSSWG